jgi:hypothetical protein
MSMLCVWLEIEDVPDADPLVIHLRTTDDGQPIHFQWGNRIEMGESAVVTDDGEDYTYRITRTEPL